MSMTGAERSRRHKARKRGEYVKPVPAGSTTHGLSFHPLYRMWQGMMARCYNQAHMGFGNYGGRGIAVWQPWHDPVLFIAWVEQNLGPRPDGWTMDRIDNDRGYEPGNLRWATRSTQARNQRDGVRPRGSAKSAARLTEEIVIECRARWAAGEAQHALAAEFGVSKPTMHKAIAGKTWRHVRSGEREGDHTEGEREGDGDG